MTILILGIVSMLLLWSLYGYFGSRVEQAKYSIIKKKNGYEIRNYPAHIVAQTTVEGTYQESMRKGFRIVAGYIFGGNVKNESIKMTSPVLMQEKLLGNTSEKIAMTTPVQMSKVGDSRVISFGMPRSYTLETLPTPLDSRVKLVEIPNKKLAAIQFAGYRSNARIQEIEHILLDALKRDDIKIIGIPTYAGYNAPWTPPWLTRNEVLVEIV